MKKEHLIKIDTAKCIGCGLCSKDCPALNISLKNKQATVLGQNCIKCGHCVAICPKAAVSITGYDQRPMEIEGPTRLDPHILLEAIRTRRSIRNFTAEQVSEEIISRIIESGRLTPTGGNAQDVSFVVIQDKKKEIENIAVGLFRSLLPLIKLLNPMAKHMTIDDDFFFKKAPVVILILSPDKINGALASANMALMAEALGLGVLYSGFFCTATTISRRLRKKLHLTHKDKVTAALVLGYSKINYRRTVQKENAVVSYL